MAHFRGTNANFTETRESSSSHASSSKSESSSVTRSGYAAQGGVMDNFGGVRYPTQGQQPPVQYQQQELPPPQQQGPPQRYNNGHNAGPPQQVQQQPQAIPIQKDAPAPAAKPKTSFKQNKVRIVGGKLFHVADDVEGPISIQFIGEHPDGGNRPYHVAKSTYPPPEKPRNATSAGGQRFHFI